MKSFPEFNDEGKIVAWLGDAKLIRFLLSQNRVAWWFQRRSNRGPGMDANVLARGGRTQAVNLGTEAV